MTPIAPGFSVADVDSPQPRSVPTDTGVWFIAGLTEKGPLSPIPVTSLGEAVTKLGARVSYGNVYDALDVFFREGGAKAWVSRVVGASAITATVVLLDAGAAQTLRVSAKGPGAYGNTLNVQVTAGDAGGEFKLVISDDVLGALEISPSLADKAAAVLWGSDSSQYVDVVDGFASVLDPAVVAATSLATGTDDRASIVTADWTTAFARFTTELGPGQVSAPGMSSTAIQTVVMAHADATNRVELLDVALDASKATLVTAGRATLGALAGYKRGAPFGPWVDVPGVVAGTTRQVSASAVVAGEIARSDARRSPNIPAAGDNGVSQFALRARQDFTEAERGDLNEAGVNILRNMFGQVHTYGYRTLANPTTEKKFLLLNNARLAMDIKNRAGLIAQSFVFRDLTPIVIAEFGGALTGLLAGYYNGIPALAGSLFGATADDAFGVDVGSTVNTPTTIAARQLVAVLSLRMAPFAERVTINVFRAAVDEVIA